MVHQCTGADLVNSLRRLTIGLAPEGKSEGLYGSRLFVTQIQPGRQNITIAVVSGTNGQSQVKQKSGYSVRDKLHPVICMCF